ncbi:MAG: DinB family protein [Acidobacteriota bacterium]
MNKTAERMRSFLLETLAEGYDRKAWHGPNLRGAIRGLKAPDVYRRPASKRHNIYEIVLHAAYWKYVVRRRLQGDRRASFGRKGSNWFPSPTKPSEIDWKNAVKLLREEQQKLVLAVTALPDRAFQPSSSGKSSQIVRLVHGIAAHDVYHAGQIQLLKRLIRRR